MTTFLEAVDALDLHEKNQWDAIREKISLIVPAILSSPGWGPIDGGVVGDLISAGKDESPLALYRSIKELAKKFEYSDLPSDVNDVLGDIEGFAAKAIMSLRSQPIDKSLFGRVMQEILDTFSMGKDRVTGVSMTRREIDRALSALFVREAITGGLKMAVAKGYLKKMGSTRNPDYVATAKLERRARRRNSKAMTQRMRGVGRSTDDIQQAQAARAAKLGPVWDL